MPKNSKEYDRQYYAKCDKTKKVRQKKERRYQLRAKLQELKTNTSCSKCSERDRRTLDFHHIRGEKLYDVSSMISAGFSWQRILEEISKCIILCANCHRKETIRE